MLACGWHVDMVWRYSDIPVKIAIGNSVNYQIRYLSMLTEFWIGFTCCMLMGCFHILILMWVTMKVQCKKTLYNFFTWIVFTFSNVAWYFTLGWSKTRSVKHEWNKIIRNYSEIFPFLLLNIEIILNNINYLVCWIHPPDIFILDFLIASSNPDACTWIFF